MTAQELLTSVREAVDAVLNSWGHVAATCPCHACALARQRVYASLAALENAITQAAAERQGVAP